MFCFVWTREHLQNVFLSLSFPHTSKRSQVGSVRASSRCSVQRALLLHLQKSFYQSISIIQRRFIINSGQDLKTQNPTESRFFISVLPFVVFVLLETPVLGLRAEDGIFKELLWLYVLHKVLVITAAVVFTSPQRLCRGTIEWGNNWSDWLIDKLQTQSLPLVLRFCKIFGIYDWNEEDLYNLALPEITFEVTSPPVSSVDSTVCVVCVSPSTISSSHQGRRWRLKWEPVQSCRISRYVCQNLTDQLFSCKMCVLRPWLRTKNSFKCGLCCLCRFQLSHVQQAL